MIAEMESKEKRFEKRRKKLEMHKNRMDRLLSLLVKFFFRATWFSGMMFASLLLFSIIGNYQQFLDSNLFMLFKLTVAAAIFVSFAAFVSLLLTVSEMIIYRHATSGMIISVIFYILLLAVSISSMIFTSVVQIITAGR